MTKYNSNTSFMTKFARTFDWAGATPFQPLSTATMLKAYAYVGASALTMSAAAMVSPEAVHSVLTFSIDRDLPARVLPIITAPALVIGALRLANTALNTLGFNGYQRELSVRKKERQQAERAKQRKYRHGRLKKLAY